MRSDASIQSNPIPRRQAMEPAGYAKIRHNPKFAELVHQRNALARTLTIVMFVLYFGFILLVAFGKGFLGMPISDGSITTVGILVGLLVIVSAFVLTGIYVAKANTTFDTLNRQIIEESK
jgi:uncharacterized membrane protein (DUF485 family)